MLKDKKLLIAFLILILIPLLLKSYILLIIILVIPIFLLLSLKLLLINDEKLLLITLSGIFVSTFLSHIQDKLIYSADYFAILLLLKLFINVYKKNALFNKNDYIFICGTLMLIFINFISWAANSYSIVTLLWGIRTAYKFVIFYLFASTSKSLSDKAFKRITKLIIVWTIIQAPIMIYQYYITNGDADNVVGTFAENGTGVLSEFLTFAVVITAFLLIKKEISKTLFFIILGISIVGCAIAEIKMGFVSIAISIIVIFLFEGRKLLKNIISIIIILLLFIYGYEWFVSLYPQHDFLSKEFLNNYLSEGSYDSDKSINRF